MCTLDCQDQLKVTLHAIVLSTESIMSVTDVNLPVISHFKIMHKTHILCGSGNTVLMYSFSNIQKNILLFSGLVFGQKGNS